MLESFNNKLLKEKFMFDLYEDPKSGFIKVGKRFISIKEITIPEVIKDRCTGFEEGTFRDDISSTELRLTKN